MPLVKLCHDHLQGDPIYGYVSHEQDMAAVHVIRCLKITLAEAVVQPQQSLVFCIMIHHLALNRESELHEVLLEIFNLKTSAELATEQVAQVHLEA